MRNRDELVAALHPHPRPPEGPLEEARRASARAQAARVVIPVPSRTTLIGWGPGAALVNGGLSLVQVQDVIIRNLHIRDAYDHFPAWDPRDNGHGEWNSEYDNITLRQAEKGLETGTPCCRRRTPPRRWPPR